MIRIAHGALAAAISQFKDRQQFNKALAEFQSIQFQIAQAATELEAARLMVYNAARLRAVGQDISREGAMAKLYASHRSALLRTCMTTMSASHPARSLRRRSASRGEPSVL